MNTLDSLATVSRLVGFFVANHNDELPLVEFGGRTPADVYAGLATTIPDELDDARDAARTDRLESNRFVRCHLCDAEARGSPVELVAPA